MVSPLAYKSLVWAAPAGGGGGGERAAVSEATMPLASVMTRLPYLRASLWTSSCSWVTTTTVMLTLLMALKQLHDVHRHFGVNVAGGLVRDDQLGVMHQRTRHSHTLLLAAGEGIREAWPYPPDAPAPECTPRGDGSPCGALFVTCMAKATFSYTVMLGISRKS